MVDFQFFVWLFPLLFMFHDFEEIIFLHPWSVKNVERLTRKYPRVASRLMSTYVNLATPSIAFGIAEIFILLSVVTIISVLLSWYYLWFGMFLFFTIHLVVHCIPCLVIRGYVPGVVTSVLCLPFCSYIVWLFMGHHEAPLDQIILFIIVGFAVWLVYFAGVQLSMRVFNKWLSNYRERSRSHDPPQNLL